MNTNTSFVVRNKNARTLRLIGEKIIQLASLAERAVEVGRPLEVEGGLMLHEMSDDKRDEIVYVLQVGDSEMRITVDTHTLELVGRKGFYRMGNAMPDPTFSVGNVESPYDAAVKHFADVGFSSARYSDVVSDGGMDPRNEPAPAQDEQQPVGRVFTDEERFRSDGKSGPVWWFGPLPAGAMLYAAPIAQTAPQQNVDAGLLGRIDAAIKAFTSGKASMHVPPEPTDVDMVLGECWQLVKGIIAAPVAQAADLDKLRAVVSSVAAEQFHILPWSHPHCMCSRCNLIREARDALSQQVTPQKYDDVLLPFLDLMRTELRANSGKGDRAGWLSMSRETCLLEIHYHLAKLQKATLEDAPSGIREHAADVANMSMMLVDICGLLIEQGETK